MHPLDSIEKTIVSLESRPSTSHQRSLHPRCTASSALIFRLIDIVIAILLLIMLSPLLLLTAALIWADDPRASVLFWQVRYGVLGKPFWMVKFRTMTANAGELTAELRALSEDQGQGFKIKNDPRVTGIGRVLRGAYIDELPQIYNVLRGDMSIVGPRANSYDPITYEPWQLKRLTVKPGITGSWQVMRGKPYQFAERCAIDNLYVDQKSVALDLKIMALTAARMFARTGE